MGGYGCGGLNKTHGRVEDYRYRKLDSFAFYNFLMSDKYLHYKTDVTYPISNSALIYHVLTKTASIDYGADGCWPLELSRVTNIDGVTQRMYFICPECERRVRYLYNKQGGWMCRKCAGLNYESQQKSGREELIRKMYDIVEKKLEYSYWQLEHPGLFIMDLRFVPKPKYMRWAKYAALMQELRALQDEYLMMEMCDLSKCERRRR